MVEEPGEQPQDIMNDDDRNNLRWWSSRRCSKKNQFANAIHHFVQVHQPQMAGAAVGTPSKVLDYEISEIHDLRGRIVEV